VDKRNLSPYIAAARIINPPRANGPTFGQPPIGSLPIPWLRPYEEVADGELFRLCPVRASGTSAAMVPQRISGTVGGRGFRSRLSIHPAPTAPAMRTKERAADALKGAGQPELIVRRACRRRLSAAEAVSPNAVSTKDQSRRRQQRRRPPRFEVYVRGTTGSIGSARRRSCNARQPATRWLLAALGVFDQLPSPTNWPRA
jgi:hypothetical protein